MMRVHLSLGNSTEGPVGFCAALHCNSRDEAVLLLKAALPSEMAIAPVNGDPRTEYIRVFINPDAITKRDIDDVTPSSAQRRTGNSEANLKAMMSLLNAKQFLRNLEPKGRGNGRITEALDDLVHDLKAAEASGINNDGRDAQLEYLADLFGAHLETTLRERLDEAAVSSGGKESNETR